MQSQTRSHTRSVEIPRRAAVAAGAAGVAAMFLRTAAAERGPETSATSFPRMPETIVRDFVGVCHRDIDAVRRMLDERPGLIHACWDWGFGDFETGLGAASHTGRRAIAELLIARGARVDIFAAAMLGWTDVVKAMVNADPRIKGALGPHGITLLAHAQAGGKAAEATLAWLTEQGGANQSPNLVALTPAEADVQACIGRYRVNDVPCTFEVRLDPKQRLELLADGSTPNRLYLTKDRTFFPAGVPSVEIVFDNASPASQVRIKDGLGWLTAKHIEDAPSR